MQTLYYCRCYCAPWPTPCGARRDSKEAEGRAHAPGASVPPGLGRRIWAAKQEAEERFPAALHSYVWGRPFVTCSTCHLGTGRRGGQCRFQERCFIRASRACPRQDTDPPPEGGEPSHWGSPTVLPGHPGAPHSASKGPGVSLPPNLQFSKWET